MHYHFWSVRRETRNVIRIKSGKEIHLETSQLNSTIQYDIKISLEAIREINEIKLIILSINDNLPQPLNILKHFAYG